MIIVIYTSLHSLGLNFVEKMTENDLFKEKKMLAPFFENLVGIKPSN